MVEEFWAFLSDQLDEGAIRTPLMVYKEIADGHDQLAQWFKTRKKNGLCVRPSRDVQKKLTIVSGHVVAKHGTQWATPFLKKADPWIIAHALADGGTVVTQETEQGKGQKVKVPTVCGELGVKCIDTYEMLRRLGFKTGR